MRVQKLWTRFVGLGVLGVAAVACADQITSPLAVTEPSEAVSSGERFARITISNPSTASYSLRVGGTKQMAATLHYSRGGTLPSAPYAQWMSSNPCVAKVTSAAPSWGKVTGMKAGTALIISSAFGKADTVKVKVEGTGSLDKSCEQKLWSFNTNDVSFTGEPATRYYVAPGEKLKKLVLFAPEKAVRVGTTRRVISELWYSQGGKLNGAGYVNFTVTDGSVAKVSRMGVVTGLKPGRVKLIVRLGSNFADTVPVYVTR